MFGIKVYLKRTNVLCLKIVFCLFANFFMVTKASPVRTIPIPTILKSNKLSFIPNIVGININLQDFTYRQILFILVSKCEYRPAMRSAHIEEMRQEGQQWKEQLTVHREHMTFNLMPE